MVVDVVNFYSVIVNATLENVRMMVRNMPSISSECDTTVVGISMTVITRVSIAEDDIGVAMN